MILACFFVDISISLSFRVNIVKTSNYTKVIKIDLKRVEWNLKRVKEGGSFNWGLRFWRGYPLNENSHIMDTAP